MQTWMEDPDCHVISDDMRNFYNLCSRKATFQALRSRTRFQGYIPAYRLFYKKPARIVAARGEGAGSVPQRSAGTRLNSSETCAFRSLGHGEFV